MIKIHHVHYCVWRHRRKDGAPGLRGPGDERRSSAAADSTEEGEGAPGRSRSRSATLVPHINSHACKYLQPTVATLMAWCCNVPVTWRTSAGASAEFDPFLHHVTAHCCRGDSRTMWAFKRGVHWTFDLTDIWLFRSQSHFWTLYFIINLNIKRIYMKTHNAQICSNLSPWGWGWSKLHFRSVKPLLYWWKLNNGSFQGLFVFSYCWAVLHI